MQSFLGEAGKGGNALKQVAQREGVDNSLFRDRFAPQAGSSSSQQPFRQGFRPGAPPTANGGQLTAHPPQPFNLSHLSAALADPSVSGPVVRSPAHHAPQHFEQSWAASGPALHQPQPHHSARSSPGPGFAAEFTARPPQQHAPQSGWAESFQSGKGKGRALEPMQPGPEQHHIPSQYANQAYGGYQPMMPYQPSFTPMYSQFQGVQQPAMQPPPQMQQPGQADKGMDEAFEKAMADWKAMGDAHKESQHENGVQEQTQNTEAKEQADDGIVDRGETKGELDQIWESLRPEAERLNKLAEWENDFSQFTHDEDDLFDTLNESLNRPDVGQTPLEEQMRLEEGFTHPLAEGAPSYMGGNHSDIINDMVDTQKPRSYEYTLPNRFDSMDPQEAWTEANRLLNSGGSLTDATLLLESYLRRAADVNAGEPAAKELAAWSLLGKTHAMNEKEEKALAAFEEGRQAIKGGGAEAGMGDMLTNLAISYVNESADFEALQVLHQFLALVHPEHAGAAPQRESIESRANPWALHHEVTDKYLNLARDQYNSKQVVDPDVQVGLGTLYYMMGEYNEARDCWVAALGERPDDYLLWNRLGATLANGGNPEEAVDAYRRALELKPLFTRATFNLGVACLNIGVHKEAAEHILAALSLHSRDAEKEQRDSTPMWLTLRRALIALDMLELSGKARPGADLQTFREAGFDF